jgi:two-component system chemotaxis sensor kinase CheA
MSLEAARQTFMAESRELLAALERSLLALESAPTDGAHITEAFRAAHTIKGSAGIFGFDQVVAFTHLVEGVLERVRSGAIAAEGDLIELLLASRDHIALLIARGEKETGLSGEEAAAGVSLATRLQRHLEPKTSQATIHAPAPAPAVLDCWLISLRFGRDVLRNGMDPLSLLRYLATLGEIACLKAQLDTMPAAAAMDPESCYLGLDFELRTTADEATIAAAFDFVRDDCAIRMERASRRVTDVPGKPRAAGDAFAQDTKFVRVRADKLDQLIDLVGELVISGASASLLARATASEALHETTSNMARLVEQVRDRALQLRMVPIGETFERFPRLVRDAGRELGKEIDLVINGADTELDKTMIERISDPLMHLIRNAIDHGIDSGEARQARGKPARGKVTLDAYHDSGSVVIEVSDDGEGLNRERILAKAVQLGRIAAGQALSEREIFDLVWEPGFSTAEQLSNLSGRGVGMDVVKRNIEALRGTVEIESAAGQGATFRMRLPLTLAIIEGFLVQAGQAKYVLPLEMVVECLALADHDLQARADCSYVNLRGEVLPFVRLREAFGIEGHAAGRENLVVVQYGGRRAGIVVDRLLGEIQTVIKPLSRIFAKLQAISGSTVLGSGEVALILDLPALIESAAQRKGKDFPTALSPASDARVGAA